MWWLSMGCDSYHLCQAAFVLFLQSAYRIGWKKSHAWIPETVNLYSVTLFVCIYIHVCLNPNNIWFPRSMIHLTVLIATRSKISPDLVILFVGLGRGLSSAALETCLLFSLQYFRPNVAEEEKKTKAVRNKVQSKALSKQDHGRFVSEAKGLIALFIMPHSINHLGLLSSEGAALQTPQLSDCGQP